MPTMHFCVQKDLRFYQLSGVFALIWHVGSASASRVERLFQAHSKSRSDDVLTF